jgi:hypothetical protein
MSFRQFIATCIAIGIIALFIVVVKSNWSKKQTIRLPITVGMFIVALSLPGITGLDNDIHTPYSTLYAIINFPILLFVDIDKIEILIFRNGNLWTSNLIFAAVSVTFWVVFSFIIGLLIDNFRKIKNQ